MSKKKKIIIAIIVALILIGAAVTLFFVLKKDKDKKGGDTPKPVAKQQITIVFDADGGEKVDDIKVAKGTSFQLPETSKEGYTFAGWYNGSKLYTDDDTAEIESNIVLTAKWEKKEEEQKTLKVVFDSKGGSKVKDMTFTCGKDGSVTLNSLPKPKKDAYNFLSWEDKHGKSILNGAKLTCDSAELKLYASWEYDGPTANPEQDPNASKTYKCPSGYTLNGETKKCTISKDASFACPSATKEYNGKCIKATDKENGTRTCPTISIEGHDYVGTKVEAGTTFCYYAPVSYYTTKESCESVSNGLSIDSDGHYDWRGEKCYKAALTNYKTTCSTGYTYYTKDIIQGLGIHDAAGCYKTYDKVGSCEPEYTLNGSKCVKTIDATLE